MDKATRYIQDGKVNVTQNTWTKDPNSGALSNYAAATTNGDTGTWNTEIWRDDPSSNAVTRWSCDCLLPGEEIIMWDGSLKKIEEVRNGDLVLTASGDVGVVTATSKRDYVGDIIGLKISGSSKTVWVTAEHKLPTKDWGLDNLDYRPANEWVEGDFSFFPAPKYDCDHLYFDCKTLFPDLIEKDGYLYKKNKLYGTAIGNRRGIPKFSSVEKPVVKNIIFDENFARLAGLYVAEGTAWKDEIRWHLNPNESDLADEIVERVRIYGVENASWKLVPEKSMIVVTAYHRKLKDIFLYLFSTGSKTKKINPIIFAAPESFLKIFIDAWVEGDGHNDNYNRTIITTANDTLAIQARIILALIGKESVIYKKKNNISKLVPNGTNLNLVSFLRNPKRKQNKNKRFYENGKVFQYMSKPVSKHYVGKVYNLEISDNHTFVIAPGIASKNCPWGEVSWGRTRQFKKFEGRPCAHCLALHWMTQNAPQEPPPVDQGPTPQAPQGAPGTPTGPTQTPNIPGAANITQQAEEITKPTPIINEAPAQPLIQSQPLPPGQSPFGMGGFSHILANEFLDDINAELNKDILFQNGEYVRVKPGLRLIGYDRDNNSHVVTGNRVGQIIFCDQEDAVAIFSIPSGRMEPHLVRVETNPENLAKAPSNMKPFTSDLQQNPTVDSEEFQIQ